MIPDFAQRLRRCKQQGRLSHADMAIWFGRSASCTRKWMYYDVNPFEMYEPEVLSRLERLEYIMESKGGGPILPFETPHHKRKDYLSALLNP